MRVKCHVGTALRGKGEDRSRRRGSRNQGGGDGAPGAENGGEGMNGKTHSGRWVSDPSPEGPGRDHGGGAGASGAENVWGGMNG